MYSREYTRATREGCQVARERHCITQLQSTAYILSSEAAVASGLQPLHWLLWALDKQKVNEHSQTVGTALSQQHISASMMTSLPELYTLLTKCATLKLK